MAFSSISVANSFLELASGEGKSLTNMQVQKLVYLAHGYCWALLGKPLFYHDVHAWQWGPVIPKLYKKLQRYGSGTVTEQIEDSEPQIPKDSEEYSVVTAVWKAFGGYTGATLSRITHQDDSPWSTTWKQKEHGIIPDDLIRDYYQKSLPHGAAA